VRSTLYKIQTKLKFIPLNPPVFDAAKIKRIVTLN